jgi:MFS family permease
MKKPTDWTQVCLILAAGVVGAAQIGKVAIAIPALREDLDLSLVAVSWIFGAYALLGAFGGLGAGMIVSRFPMRAATIAAIALIGIGNLIGAAASGAALLIVSRIVEGIGFLGLVISGPTQLRNMSLGRNQDIVFACWAAYIPVGTAIMLFAGPWLLRSGWQTLWLVNAAVAAALVALMLGLRPAPPQEQRASVKPPMTELAELLKTGGPLLLACAFTLYAIQYYALSTFLPILLVERMGLSLGAAGTISALAVLANGAGNIAAGFILKFGAPLWSIAGVVFITVGLTGFGVFSPGLPTMIVAGSAAVGLAVTALLPASVIATAPRLAPTVGKLALTMGLIQQAAAIGQFAGPVILATWVERFDWSGAAYLFLAIAVLGLVIVAVLRRIMRGT